MQFTESEMKKTGWQAARSTAVAFVCEAIDMLAWLAFAAVA